MKKIFPFLVLGSCFSLPSLAQTGRVVRVENVTFKKPASYDTMSRREQLLSFIRAQKALKSNQTMKVPRFLLKPGQSGSDLDREIRALENELDAANDAPLKAKYLRELGVRLNKASSFDERQKVLGRVCSDSEFVLQKRRLWLTQQEKVGFMTFWLGKSRNRDLRDQLIHWLKPLGGLKEAVPEMLAYAEELTKQDLPKVSASPSINMFADQTPIGDLTRGYRVLQLLLDVAPKNPKVQQLLGGWIVKATLAEPFEFYDKLSSANQRKAKERFAAIIEPSYSRDGDREMDTHTFLVLCRLSAKFATQTVAHSIETLAKIQRSDLRTLEQISVPEVATALGSLRVEGRRAASAIPTLLKVIDAKSDDYVLVVGLPDSRFRKLRRRLAVFRAGATEALKHIDPDWQPQPLGRA